MKGDIPAAAFRLSQQLPVRVHLSQRLAPTDGRVRHCANNVRPVIVNHRQYESLTEAGRQLEVSREAIRNMIRTGKNGARYV
jgi:hypothetical protein